MSTGKIMNLQYNNLRVSFLFHFLFITLIELLVHNVFCNIGYDLCDYLRLYILKVFSFSGCS